MCHNKYRHNSHTATRRKRSRTLRFAARVCALNGRLHSPPSRQNCRTTYCNDGGCVADVASLMPRGKEVTRATLRRCARFAQSANKSQMSSASDYERLRQEKIARNQQILQQLGLLVCAMRVLCRVCWIFFFLNLALFSRIALIAHISWCVVYLIPFVRVLRTNSCDRNVSTRRPRETSHRVDLVRSLRPAAIAQRRHLAQKQRKRM